jgi:tRNA nucleotidyltransferase/poly(A) polymerase
MPDYIYLLENRLSADQQNALRQLREAAREAGMILFLTGDAVRDLTSGHAVRNLEVSVHGSALKLKKILEKLGGKVWGEDEVSRSLYLCFPGTVRVDVITTQRVEYPKPGKPVFHSASIQEELRRRDFTANAMAISLNEGSFGLLMDPLNGAADIESRTLRLVSNYGFLEDPSVLIRATRYLSRLGWEFDPRTRTRYENAKGDGVIEYLSAQARSHELEEIGHEEDGLKVLQALEAEGWMKALFPAWTSASADQEKLKALHELAVELLLQGVHADMSAAQIQLLAARLSPKDLAALKKLMLRPGFAEEWNNLDALAAGFAKELLAKQNAIPSAGYKLFMSYDPEAILWLGFTSKNAAVQERFNLFLKVWPEVRQRIPHALMQEMRITPELAAYNEIVQAIFLKLIDDQLSTPEEMRAFLEPYSPPAPPPQVTIKRPRAKRGAEPKVKEPSYDDEEESEEGLNGDEDLDDIGGDEDEIEAGLSLPKIGRDTDEAESEELEAEEPKPAPAAVKAAARKHSEPAKVAQAPAPAKTEKPAPKPVAQKPEAAKKTPPAVPSKPEPKAKPVAKAVVVVAKPHAPAPKAKPAPAPAKAKTPPPAKKPAPVAVKASHAAKPVAAKSHAVAKAPVKVQPKAPVKAVPAKAAHAKAAPAKAPAKSAAAKGKPAPVASSKAGKGAHEAKPSRPVEKKALPKHGKKH